MKLPRPGSSHFGPQHLICGLCLQKRTTRSFVMAFSRVLAVSLAVAALGENHTCGVDGECNDEESSLMQIRNAPQTQWWSGMEGFSNCRNRLGDEFPCGETGRCCGDICADSRIVSQLEPRFDASRWSMLHDWGMPSCDSFVARSAA